MITRGVGVIMGALLCKGGQQTKYMNLRSREDDMMQERLLRRGSRLFTRFARCAPPPKFVLYDMEEFRQVDDHEGVRRLLLRVPEWVAQRPADSYIEYWYYFRRDGLALTPSRQLYPAARARLPWPLLHTASPEMLQNFAHVVNRVAQCQLLEVLSTMDETPYWGQEKPNFSTKVLGRTKRLNKRDQSTIRSEPWRPVSLVKDACYSVWNRNQRIG